MVVRSILFLCATEPTKTEMQDLQIHIDRQDETTKLFNIAQQKKKKTNPQHLVHRNPSDVPLGG